MCGLLIFFFFYCRRSIDILCKWIWVMKNWLGRRKHGGNFELYINFTQIIYCPTPTPRNIEIVSFMISEMAYAAILFALVSVFVLLEPYLSSVVWITFCHIVKPMTSLITSAILWEVLKFRVALGSSDAYAACVSLN